MRSHRGRQLVVSVGVAAVAGAGIGLLVGTALAEARSGRASPVVAAEAVRAAPAPVLPVQFRSAAAGFSSDEANNIEIYQKYNEGVVNVSALMPEHHWFLNAVPRYGSGAGSGTVIDREGHILTNYHVVGGAREVSVTLAGGEERAGRVIGVDPENDLAVIKLDPRGLHLTVIPFGRSADLLVGQKVLAIGNPFALSRTLTTGVVSGLGRPVRADSGAIIQEMIQTDASVNPGNSGGPLLNSHGEMIGITTTIISPSGGSVGIGFAVPIDTARRVLPELIRHGEVRRGWIDVRPVQLFPRLVQAVEPAGGARHPRVRGNRGRQCRGRGLARRRSAGTLGGAPYSASAATSSSRWTAPPPTPSPTCSMPSRTTSRATGSRSCTSAAGGVEPPPSC